MQAQNFQISFSCSHKWQSRYFLVFMTHQRSHQHLHCDMVKPHRKIRKRWPKIVVTIHFHNDVQHSAWTRFVSTLTCCLTCCTLVLICQMKYHSQEHSHVIGFGMWLSKDADAFLETSARVMHCPHQSPCTIEVQQRKVLERMSIFKIRIGECLCTN